MPFCIGSRRWVRPLIYGVACAVLLLTSLSRASSPSFAASRSVDEGRLAAVAPLAEMLDADGALQLPDGFRGSVDARGWELASDADEPPRFIRSGAMQPRVPDESSSRLDTRGGRESPIPFAKPRVPGEERWAADFVPRGARGIRTLVIGAGSDVYVSGDFTVIGGALANHVAKWDGSRWSALGFGLDYEASTLVWDNTHGILYAGGSISSICTNAECTGPGYHVNSVARWDGTSWSPLISTSPALYGVQMPVYSMTLDPQNNLYVGGWFDSLCTNEACSATTPANGIAKWSWATSQWSTLAVGANIGVTGAVYALAWWNAGGWVGSVLVAGGNFTAAGGTPMNRLAYWKESDQQWYSFWAGVDGDVGKLAVDPATQTLYAGGMFTGICQNLPPGCTPTRANHLVYATADLTEWKPLGLGVNGDVYALTINSTAGRLYAGGHFKNLCSNADCSATSPSPANNVAMIDLSTPSYPWSVLGTGIEAPGGIDDLAALGGLLYAGGDFLLESAGGVPASGIAKWTPGNPGSWSALNTGNGLSNGVNAIAADNAGNVYVGGQFKAAGGIIANNVARWNTQTRTWSTLGNGVKGRVYALTLDKEGALFVGGYFKNLCMNASCGDGSQVNNLAKWTPAPGGSGTWSPVDNGISGSVRALALDQGGNLYVGGWITGRCKDQACGSVDQVHGLVKWTRSSGLIAPFGASLPDGSDVWALAVDRTGALYAGGQFENVCTTSDCTGSLARVNDIAKWTPAGSSGVWSTLEGGLSSQAAAFALDRNDRLYVGGYFQYTCPNSTCSPLGLPVNGIALWTPNGSLGAWSQVGTGFYDRQFATEVDALVLDISDNLYATGRFDNVCQDEGCATAGTAVNGIAKWNQSTWSGLGSGLGPVASFMPQNTGFAIAWHAGTVFVGGGFSIAGGKAASFFSQYQDTSFLNLPLVTR